MAINSQHCDEAICLSEVETNPKTSQGNPSTSLLPNSSSTIEIISKAVQDQLSAILPNMIHEITKSTHIERDQSELSHNPRLAAGSTLGAIEQIEQSSDDEVQEITNEGERETPLKKANMTLEHVSSLQSSLQEGTESINIPSSDVKALYTCLTKALCLLGSLNSQLSLERRKQILEKLNPKLTSLANEPLPDAGKLLFGPSFEEKIKQRNETAKIISAASARKPTQQFFRRGASSNYRPWRGGQERGKWNYQTSHPRGRYSFRARGRGRGRFQSLQHN